VEYVVVENMRNNSVSIILKLLKLQLSVA